MSYTQDDLTKIRAAILEFGSGNRISSVTLSNGETTQFAQTSLNELRELEKDIASQVPTTTRRLRFSTLRTGKGL